MIYSKIRSKRTDCFFEYMKPILFSQRSNRRVVSRILLNIIISEEEFSYKICLLNKKSSKGTKHSIAFKRFTSSLSSSSSNAQKRFCVLIIGNLILYYNVILYGRLSFYLQYYNVILYGRLSFYLQYYNVILYGRLSFYLQYYSADKVVRRKQRHRQICLDIP